MRLRPFSIAILSILVTITALPAQGDDIRLPGLDGGQLSESQLLEGTHIVVFWTSWAPRGRDVVDRVNVLVDRWGGRASVVTINFQEDAGTVRDFLRGKAGLKAKVYLDANGELSKKHRVNSAPWLLILKNGATAFSDKMPSEPDAIVAQIVG